MGEKRKRGLFKPWRDNPNEDRQPTRQEMASDEDLKEVALIDNPSKRSTSSRKHRRLFVATDIGFTDEQQVTQPKQIIEFCERNKIIHLAKGTSETPDDIRRYLGTIHVWERW